LILCVWKSTPPLFLSPLLIAIIDIFHKVSKNILGNSDIIDSCATVIDVGEYPSLYF